MAAVEMRLENDAVGDELLAQDYTIGDIVDRHCRRLGLLVRPLINVCVMSPPLVITEPEIEEMFDILTAALNDASASLAKADPQP